MSNNFIPYENKTPNTTAPRLVPSQQCGASAQTEKYDRPRFVVKIDDLTEDCYIMGRTSCCLVFFQISLQCNLPSNR